MSIKEILGEELFENVKEKLDGKELIVNDGSYIPRERLNDKNDEIDKLEEQIKQRDTQIDQLKNDTQITDELKDKIEELQDQNKENTKQLKQELEQQKMDSAVELALTKAKAKNPKAVKALLDLEKIKLTDDEIVGLDEQLNNLKENEDYLFEIGKGNGGSGGSDFNEGNKNPDTNPWMKGNINLSEQAKLLKENPSTAQSMMKEAGVKQSKIKKYFKQIY